PFYPVGPDSQRALIGIPLGDKGSRYPLRIYQGLKRSRPSLLGESWVDVSSQTYAVEKVAFNKEKSSLITSDLDHRESARIHRALMALSKEQYWEGIFNLPVNGPIIGEYGVQRVLNRNVNWGFHKGYD